MYTLIKEVPNRRYYKFDRKLSVGLKGKPLTRYDGGTTREDMTEYFAVSDANTHIERLVFPIWFLEGFDESEIYKENPTPCVIRGDCCGGIMTMMIYGGDESTIRPDEEYLNDLWEINIKL
jgi:hypothetical protein